MHRSHFDEYYINIHLSIKVTIVFPRFCRKSPPFKNIEKRGMGANVYMNMIPHKYTVRARGGAVAETKERGEK